MPQQYRIPLTGQYNTRISSINALSGQSGVWGVGIWGIFVWGQSAQSSDKDERYINCFLTKQGAKNYVIKRPGHAANNTPAAGNVGSAILVWTGNGAGTDVISAFGATNSTIYNGTTSLGAITGKARSISETFVGTTPTLVVPSSDSTAWRYDTGVGVMTKITDVDYPGNAGFTTVGDFSHMDGFAFQMTNDARLWASDLNTVTAWTATSLDTANAYPDKGIGCIRYKNLILAFGTESIQFFYNRGLTPFPLAKIQNMTLKIGAVSSDAMAQISDSIFFAGATPQGGISIFQYDGGLARISTPEQDAQFAIAGPSNISLTTLIFYGRSFVLVKANTTTWVYVLEDKRWHEWTSATPLWYKAAGLSTGSQILTYAISNISTSGKVYVINPANLVFTDDGVAFTATIQTGNEDLGTLKSKTWDELRLVCDREVSTSNMAISSSDDDYQSFDARGTVDLSQNVPRVTRCGSSNRRAWKLSHSANTSFRIEAMEGEATIGASP
jgi:hypothetical protein